jgi:protein-S-isoprenylcysteine O-methyltransferase Ste14
MRALDTRIPPPIITAGLIGFLWLGRSTEFNQLRVQTPIWLVSAIILVALLLMCLAVWEMVRARTTVNPMRPQRSRSLVSRGIFSCSRNPIYLGDALLVVAAGLYWATWLFLPALAVFVYYITRFQIIPEETALREKFGAQFEQYCVSTRRWV